MTSRPNRARGWSASSAASPARWTSSTRPGSDAARPPSPSPVRRLSAAEVEGYVFGQLGRLLATTQVLATLGEMTGLEPSQIAALLGEKPMERLTRAEQQRVAELLLESVTVELNEITLELKTAGMEALAGEAWNEDQN